MSALLALFQVGCHSSTALVSINTLSQPPQFLSVAFPHAYFGKNSSDEDEIVLLLAPIDEHSDKSPGQPLPRMTTPPIWQLLKIQLHWRTAPAGNSDSPVANNAVLHWYVYGQAGDAGMGVLHYIGNGSVSFSPDGYTAKISIHNPELKLQDRHGQLRDPLNDFQINSTFTANANSQQLQQINDDLNKAIDQADHGNAATQP